MEESLRFSSIGPWKINTVLIVYNQLASDGSLP
jgi:hypothetical protein